MNDSRPLESWRIESVWPRPPKSTSWCATRPGRRTLWMVTPSNAAAREPSIGVEIRHVAREGLATAAGDHAAGRVDRGAGRRIHLLVMVQFDDLGGVEEAGGDRRQVHEQHAAYGEVRGDDAAELLLGAATRQLVDERGMRPLVPITGRTFAASAASASVGVHAAFVKSMTTSGLRRPERARRVVEQRHTWRRMRVRSCRARRVCRCSRPPRSMDRRRARRGSRAPSCRCRRPWP